VSSSRYTAMLELAAMKGGRYFCWTSNIDGVFQRAGFDPGKGITAIWIQEVV
jgi:NAD-dependent SIR2 family protein deacetylase